jgi:hypothetical protein
MKSNSFFLRWKTKGSSVEAAVLIRILDRQVDAQNFLFYDRADVNPRKSKGLTETPDSKDGCIVFNTRTEQAHILNRTAAFVFHHCSGKNSVADIIELARAEYRLKKPPREQVESALKNMAELEIIRWTDHTPKRPSTLRK